ncbi:MAG: cell division protein FtsB [Lautropia sp.]|nr:cell division protein FtsB [Lautropia sp.]
MRLLTGVLFSLLLLIQYPLWLGQGSWLRVWKLDQQLALQKEINVGKRLRNEGLEAEAEDLKNGTSAVEERARYSLGMVREDEIFVQINPAPTESHEPPEADAAP